MTDLSTSNLKRLLDETTPGPWTFREEIADTISGTQEIGHEVYAAERFLFGVCGDPVTDEYPGNLTLAALAPELADEVLRMREALRDLSEVWEAVSIDPTRTPAEQQLAAAVVDHIDQILGDHDG